MMVCSPAANATPSIEQTFANEETAVNPFPTKTVERKEAESTVPSATPVTRGLEEEARKLPAAATQQQAEANQVSLEKRVKAAIAAGESKRLLETTKNPDVAADLLRFGKVRSKSKHTPKSTYSTPAEAASVKIGGIFAHSSGCYGSPADEWYWTVAGATVAWIYVRENGWCGSSGRITWYGGPTFAHWSQGPFCIGGMQTNYSWDAYPSWIHMAIWGSLGASYPWGCLTYHGGKTQVRIAWNGYYDLYNDYGF
ncbi:MAG: hypothetical protein ACHQT9_00750 [Candidatus Saccharimonadales bacterium]